MNKKLWLGIVASISIVCVVSAVASDKGFASEVSKYDKFINASKSHKKGIDPDGKAVGYSSIDYHKNNDKDKSILIQPENLKGFVSDEELAKKGGKYTRKQLMTYREYVNLGIDDMVRHDIDPERMVWVFTSEYNGAHLVGEQKVEKGSVTTVCDAETGDFLGYTATSEDANSFVLTDPAPPSN